MPLLLAELSAEVAELSTPAVEEEWQRQANGEVLSNGQLFLECAEEADVPLSELQALLKRQTEVARAVADQEQSAWKMLHILMRSGKGTTVTWEFCLEMLELGRFICSAL